LPAFTAGTPGIAAAGAAISGVTTTANKPPFPASMTASLIALIATLRSTLRSRLDLEAEILALRHQLAVLHRQAPRRPRLRQVDRLLWVLLWRLWPHWRRAIQIVDARDRHSLAPRRVCARLVVEVTAATAGPSPAVAADLRALIHQIWAANPLWGARRIHGELRKLGIEIAQATVATYLTRDRRRPGPPSQTWRTFLANHVSQLASIDFFTVPMATFRVLFVFVVLAHDRRRIVHVNVTAHPAAAWTAQQLREACPATPHRASSSEIATRSTGLICGGPPMRWGSKSRDGAPGPLAESVHGAPDRFPAPRMPRPRHRLERARVAPLSPAVPRLLSRLADPPLPRQGRARPPRRCSHRSAAPQSSNSRTSADCTTTTNVPPPDRHPPGPRPTAALALRRCALGTAVLADVTRTRRSGWSERPPGDAHRRAIRSSSDADGVSGRSSEAWCYTGPSNDHV